MICPKCKIPGYGSKCKYCGASLVPDEETDKMDLKNPVHDTARIAPLKEERDDIKYRDDVSDTISAADDEYYDTDKDISGYSYYEDGKKDSKKLTVAILSVSVIVLFIISFIFAKSMFFPAKRVSTEEEPKATSDGRKTETEKLYETAEKYMKIDDFKNAEELYLEIFKLSDEKEAKLLYDILFSYNRAEESYEKADYEAAKESLKKIPVEYIDYDISEKIEKLSDSIDEGLKAYEIFENVRNLMKSKDYDGAGEEIELIEEKYLSSDDSDTLDEIKAELKKINEDKKEFTTPEAESFLQEYCYALEKAVNEGDFGHVSPYLDSSAFLTQKDAVSYCVSEGIAKKFESLRIKDIKETDAKKWDVEVSETETVTFVDGIKETKTYSRIYTIEYINSDYYITAINGE